MSGNAQAPVEADSTNDAPLRNEIQADSTGVAVTVVGLGASAGGLEALNKFFQKVPRHSGLAFVIVQHLDPTHDSLLSEILQRSTPLPVYKVHDGMTVEADCIYVIPPNRYMTLEQGILRLGMPEQPRGRRMAIDQFFISMAHDRHEAAIAIILSGTGSDGTIGAQAIYEQGGMVIAQAPATAKYDGMPESVIRSGFVSHILPVEAIPAMLLSRKPLLKIPDTAIHGIDKILLTLRTNDGHDFSQYKKQTMGRRIERRMQVHGIDDPRVYARFIQENQTERRALFKELLINVTSFFRDPQAFEALEKNILPMLLDDKPESHAVRIWVAGCASGEEAYSIAMLLHEYMGRTKKRLSIKLYATDLDDEAIDQARIGLYPQSIADDVSIERLRDFFIEEPNGYKVIQPIREMVVFATQNVVNDPPFIRLDLLCCRNLLIYLEPQLQNQLIQKFYFALQPGGIFFVSPSEGVGSQGDLFTLIDQKSKFYRATSTLNPPIKRISNGPLSKQAGARSEPEEFMKTPEPINFTKLTKHMLLQTFAPASVVTDVQGNMLFVHGDTGKYLRLTPGKPSLNVMDMAHEGLQMALRSAIHTVVTDSVEVRNRETPLLAQQDSVRVSFSVRLLPGPDLKQMLLLISFEDVAPTRGPDDAMSSSGPQGVANAKDMQRYMAYTKASLQATIEQQQAAHEDTQAINEELQATNEELETSREELQSINEELMTVNTELQVKIEQLSEMQNDMKNLLDNIDVGTIFLDESLLLRRFSREAAHLYNLSSSDLGRALGDIKSRLEGGDLIEEARSVLETLKSHESQVKTTDGNVYLARIQPYRTVANIVRGVVFTFTDISDHTRLEKAIQTARTYAEAIVDTIREPLLVLTPDLTVISASQAFYRFFQVEAYETLGRPVFELGGREWDIPALREILEKILPDRQTLQNYKIKLDFPAIGLRSLILDARCVVDRDANAQLILLVMTPDAQYLGEQL